MPVSESPASAPVRTPAAFAYRPQLDGIRTVAVLTVVLFHADVPGAGSGFLGLDLFFVLSGFLVTSVVLHGADTHGELRLGAFFARRVRRLLPAAVVTVLGTSALFVLLASQPERLEIVSQARAALLYVANWQFIADGADYFAHDLEQSPFLHFWSLAVEEQFYVLLPLLLLVWWRRGQRREGVLLLVLLALVAASALDQAVWAQIDPTWAYYATDARLYQLMSGAALAVLLRIRTRLRPDSPAPLGVSPAALAAVGAVGLAVLATELVELAPTTRNLLATPVLAALVVGVHGSSGSWVSRVLSLAPLTYLGRISYGIYLWHWPVLLALGRIFEIQPPLTAALALVLSVAMASMSYHALEMPIRQARSLNGWWWPTVAVGLTVSVLAALVVAPRLLESGRAPVVAAAGSGGNAQAERALDNSSLADPVPPIDFADVRDDDGPDDVFCGPDAPEDCLLADGDGTHVVLVGDSQARMLAPALEQLAEENGARLSASFVTGCPWQDGLYNTRNAGQVQDDCQTAREDFYTSTLPAMEPDVVVLVGLARSSADWEGVVQRVDGEQQPLHTMQLEATERTVELINDAGAEAVLVRSILGTEGFDIEGFDPLDCLARADRLADCVVSPPLERPVADGIYEAAALDDDGAEVVDLNPVICPDAPLCLPVVDGTVVWFNNNHVTSTYLTERRQEIWATLGLDGQR